MILLACLLLATAFCQTNAIATMAIDLGSEFMKVAIVKPGVPMETALNRDSQRKTPSVVSLRNGERSIGESALSTAVKFPPNAFIFSPTIVGKSLDSPAVQAYKERFPFYELTTGADGTLSYTTPDKRTIAVEEVLAMLLENAQETAQKFADHPMKDAVITVPPYFTQADRKAVLRAADYAGLTVLQLMNNNAAVALNFGIFRSKSFNKTAQYYMFFDMGSSSTTATVVSYQVGRVREKGMAEEHPQLHVLGVGYDETLGAASFILRLRDKLASEFNKMKLSNKDVTKNARAMAKLYKEAGRVFRVLSANKEAYAQIENVFDDKDFKWKVTREQMETLCADLYDRIHRPVESALNMAQVPNSLIKEVILMGGGTRNPRVQDMIMKATGKSELGKSINTDEAAALGAVYQAAHLSPGFRVKRFVVKDATLFPLAVDFKTAEDKKDIKRILFNLGNPYPQRKVMTFNKHTEDFDISLGYTSLGHLSEIQQKSLGKTQLFKYNLKGVGAAVKKHEGKQGAISKGVKAHFRMDDSGIINLDRVESLFEVTPTAEGAGGENSAEKDSSTLSKLGESIGSLFGSGSEKKADESTEKKEEKQKTDESAQKRDEQKETDAKAAASAESNATAANATAANATTVKPELVREPVNFVAENQNAPEPDEATRKKSREFIVELRNIEEEKRKLDQAKNELESYIFESKDKLYQDDYVKCSTESERQSYLEKLGAAQDWYDEQGMDTKREEFTAKYTELKTMLNDLATRVREMLERPKAFKLLKDMLNHTRTFWDTMKNMTGEGNVFTQAEYTTLGNLINDTQDWQQARLQEMEQQDLAKEPLVRVEDIRLKMSALEREISYLLGKIKYYVPPTKQPEQAKDSEAEAEKKEGKEKKEEKEEKKEEDKEEKKEEKEEKKEEEKEGQQSHKEESAKTEANDKAEKKETQDEAKEAAKKEPTKSDASDADSGRKPDDEL